MEIKKSDTKPKVEVDGKVYELQMPKLKHQIMLEDIISDTDKGKFPAVKVKDCLVSLGLPEDVALDLEPEHFLQIIEGLSNLKKSQAKPTLSSPG